MSSKDQDWIQQSQAFIDARMNDQQGEDRFYYLVALMALNRLSDEQREEIETVLSGLTFYNEATK